MSFQLQVFEGSDAVIIDKSTNLTLFTTSEPLNKNTTYNWRVRGNNEDRNLTGILSSISRLQLEKIDQLIRAH